MGKGLESALPIMQWLKDKYPRTYELMPYGLICSEVMTTKKRSQTQVTKRGLKAKNRSKIR